MPEAGNRSVRPRSLAAPAALRIDAKLAEDRLAGDGALAKQHLAARPGGQEHVDPASEADQADPLASSDPVAFLDERHDAARDQPGDLGESDPDSILALNQEMLPFVVVASLVEVRVEELARHIGDTPDGTGDRRSIDVDIKH